MDVESAQARLREFAAARDWERFHGPKNLAASVSVEAAELLEVFQWLSEQESAQLADEDVTRASEEMADVLIYLLRLADVLGVDLMDAVHKKIALNEQKYPVEVAKGNATKSTRRT